MLAVCNNVCFKVHIEGTKRRKGRREEVRGKKEREEGRRERKEKQNNSQAQVPSYKRRKTDDSPFQNREISKL